MPLVKSFPNILADSNRAASAFAIFDENNNRFLN